MGNVIKHLIKFSFGKICVKIIFIRAGELLFCPL